jgi:hypothetical protein
MSAKRILLIVMAISAVILAVGVGPGRAGTVQASLPLAEANGGAVTIPYAGKLADPSGQAVPDGVYDFSFALYAAETGGEPLWSEVQQGVAIKDGAFAVALGSVATMPDSILRSSEHWLAVAVRGPGETSFTTLSPRLPVNAASPQAPTAAACPHTHVGEYWTTSELNGLRVETTNPIGNAIAGNANNGTSAWGVVGNSASGSGVVGQSTTGVGVRAVSGGGTKYNAALRADNTNTTNGMAGYLTNNSAYHTAHFQNSGIGGVLYLENGGDTGGVGGFDFITAVSNGGGDTQFRVTSDGSAYSDGGWKGAADFAELISTDGDSAAYEPGDVLVISVESDRAVVLSSDPYSPMVFGVYSEKPGFVGSPHVMEEQRKDEIPVAVVGIVSCKVSAENGAIHPGDLLVTSATPGHAMRADRDRALPGTILGKALESLDSGTGVIQVLVTLQ